MRSYVQFVVLLWIPIDRYLLAAKSFKAECIEFRRAESDKSGKCI